MTSVAMVSALALAVFYLSKTPGYGRFNASTLILLFALSLTGILAVAGKVDRHGTVSILLAVIGFASGLFAGASITDGDAGKIADRVANILKARNG